MTDILTVCTLPHVDGYARDDVKFSAAFTSADADGDNACQAMIAFVNNANVTGARKLASYVSTTRSRAANACYVQAFDITDHLDGSPHGSAVKTVPFTLAAAGAGGMKNVPAEVAAVVSYRSSAYASALEVGPVGPIPTSIRAQVQGAPATHTGRTRPRARQRGRLYFGPLMDNAVGADVGGGFRAKLDDDFRQTLGEAAALMATATIGTDALAQCVWSRRSATMQPVQHVLVDDAFDIQRRRGEKYVNRTTYI